MPNTLEPTYTFRMRVKTIRRLESSIEDKMRGIVTYELPDGRRIDLDARTIRKYGAHEILREAGFGHLLPTSRVKVVQDGREVGTLPPDFDPYAVKSASFLYEPRPGDFKREGDAWIAKDSLGPGDLEAVPGFVWSR
jgi:hypothetical protein